MPKRFTDTKLWDEDWFLDLPTGEKLFWCYIKDQCDHAGLWRPNFRRFERLMGHRINQRRFLEHINTGRERIKVLPNGRWWVTGFVAFQYGDTLRSEHRVHSSVICQLEKNQVPNYSTGYGFRVSIGLGKTMHSLKEKEKEKEKEKDIACISGVSSSSSTDTITSTSASTSKKRKPFTPPTVEQVADYCRKRKNGVDAQAFVDFYASKGWVVGKSPMKNWEAAIRTWEKKSYNQAPQPAKSEPQIYY